MESYECLQCNALFDVEIVESDDDDQKVRFCPLCGDKDIRKVVDYDYVDEDPEDDE